MSATNLKSHVKNDSPCLSAKWESPWTHLGRPSHFLFGSVTTTGHKKDSLEPNVVSVGHLYNPSSVKGLHSCNSQHGHKATQDKETFLSWGKFTVLWIHKAEKAVCALPEQIWFCRDNSGKHSANCLCLFPPAKRMWLQCSVSTFRGRKDHFCVTILLTFISQLVQSRFGFLKQYGVFCSLHPSLSKEGAEQCLADHSNGLSNQKVLQSIYFPCWAEFNQIQSSDVCQKKMSFFVPHICRVQGKDRLMQHQTSLLHITDTVLFLLSPAGILPQPMQQVLNPQQATWAASVWGCLPSRR